MLHLSLLSSIVKLLGNDKLFVPNFVSCVVICCEHTLNCSFSFAYTVYIITDN